jgi:hypothetical protein
MDNKLVLVDKVEATYLSSWEEALRIFKLNHEDLLRTSLERSFMINQD